MNFAPPKVGNFEVEKLERVDFFLLRVICLNAQGGAG